MAILVLLAHPNPGSLNHAIAQAVQECLVGAGHEVWFHDLCAEGFDPLIPAGEFGRDAVLPEAIERHCSELEQAEGIVIVHPNWWGQPPAIMKGWIDRVVRPGSAYEFVGEDGGEGVPVGLLKAKWVVVLNTSNTEEGRENDLFLDPLETLWKNCVFGLCGVEAFYRRMFRIVVTSTEEQRKGWLNEVREILLRATM